MTTRDSRVGPRSITRAAFFASGLIAVILLLVLFASRRGNDRAAEIPAIEAAESVVPRRRKFFAETPQRSPLRTLLTTAAVLAAGVTVAVIAAGGTYAIWNDTTPVASTTVTTGSTGLTVNGATTFSVDVSMNALLPGRSVVPAAPIVLTNTGITPLNVTAPTITYTAASSGLSPYLQVSMRPATGSTCTVTALATPLPAAIAPISFAVGQSVSVCLEVRLSTSAPATVQGAAATFLINLTATQVRP